MLPLVFVLLALDEKQKVTLSPLFSVRWTDECCTDTLLKELDGVRIRDQKESTIAFKQCLLIHQPLPVSTLSSPPSSIPLISPSVVEIRKIIVGEVWLSGTQMTIIFICVCVSDSASDHGSISHFIQLLAASEMLTWVDNSISDKRSMDSGDKG